MLAERGVGRREVEDVVDDLEAHPEVATEAGERVERGVADARDHAADPTRRREQRRGLALDRGRVVLLGAVDVEEVLQLEHLPAAQLADGGGEQRGHVGAERRGQRRRASQEEVAGEDGDDVAPAGVDARHAAPGLGLVDHVVVVQRPEVDELAGDGPGDRVGRGSGPAPCPNGEPAPSVLAYAAHRVRVGRSRLPPAPMRWVATSARNGSGVLTESRRD